MTEIELIGEKERGSGEEQAKRTQNGILHPIAGIFAHAFVR
ncbi:hypothetical protein [Nodularia harveyana]